MSEIYTGYFAKSRFYEKKKLKQISVAQFNPSWYNGVSFPELAPSKELLGDYKYNGISQEEYKIRYLNELSRPAAMRSIEKLKEMTETSDRDIILLCYEVSEDFCHRHLLADFLNQYEPEVFRIREY